MPNEKHRDNVQIKLNCPVRISSSKCDSCECRSLSIYAKRETNFKNLASCEMNESILRGYRARCAHKGDR